MILVFGMFALHTSVLLMGDHQAIKKQQENNIATLFPEEQADGNLPPQILEARSIINRLLHNGVWVYWSVFAMGLAGFVLVILNADKMRRLQVVDEERKKTSLCSKAVWQPWKPQSTVFVLSMGAAG